MSAATKVTTAEAMVWGTFAATQDRRDGEFIGPSGVGQCYRQMAYKYLQVTPTEVANGTGAADTGTLIHKGITTTIREHPDFDARLLDVEVRVQVEGLPRAGEADIVDWQRHVVIDVKTMGGRAWQARVDADAPYPHQWDQVDIYALGLADLEPSPGWQVAILAVNRDSGERVLWQRPADPHRARRLVDGMRHRHDSLIGARLEISVAGQTAEGVAERYPREGDGPGTGFPCDWGSGRCAWLSACWPDAPAPLSPQSQTVVDNPDEVEGHAAAYMQALRDERDAADRKRAAGAYLKGITGKFGDYQVQPVAFKRKPTVDTPAAVEALTGAGLPVPWKDGAEVSYPKVSRTMRG